MKVTVNLDRCCGHALCQMACPEVFGGDEAGRVELLMEEVPEALRRSARNAAASCPEVAIHLDETPSDPTART